MTAYFIFSSGCSIPFQYNIIPEGGKPVGSRRFSLFRFGRVRGTGGGAGAGIHPEKGNGIMAGRKDDEALFAEMHPGFFEQEGIRSVGGEPAR